MNGRSKRSPIFKAISLFLALTFALYNVSFAVTKNDVGVPEITDTTSPLAVEDIGIAIDSGTIKSKFSGKTDKVIVHIQDAHCNYEAQSNINKMLEQLTKEAGVDIISVEGAEGIVDTTWFRAFPDAEIRKEVATYFMKKGEITGAEFFSITSDFKGTIFGAETRDYYVKNLRAFTDVYPYKDTIEKYFVNMRTIANRLKSIVYSKHLKELDLKVRAFDDKEIELSEYAGYLDKKASRSKVDRSNTENFKKLVKTLEYEDKIDFDIVDQERSQYIDSISKKLTKENMTELVAQSIRFKKGHIKAVEFYSYLRDLAKEHDVDMVHEHPNLFYYYIYTKLYDGINNEGLFKEIDIIEVRLKEKLFKNDTQKKLDKYSSMIDMFVDLTNIELTNDDYDLFKEYQEEFTFEDVLVFLKSLSDKYNLNYTIDGMPVQITENIPKMIDFYEIAIKRDKALIDNTLKQMKKAGTDRCVLIAGGFHTRGIKDILEKKGISYVVVTPKITKNVETPYIKVLTNQRTSLEDIITESAAMPGIGITASREDIVRPKGDMLSPLLRVAYTIPMYLGAPEDLKELSDAVGAIEGERTLEAAAVDSYKEMVAALVRGWLVKVRAEATPEVWETAVENWPLLMGSYLKKYEKEATKQGVQVIEGLKVPSAVLTEEQVTAVSQEFRAIFEAEVIKSKTPGTEAIRLDEEHDLYESLTAEQATALDEVIAGLMAKVEGALEAGEQEDKYMQKIVVEAPDADGKATKNTMEIVMLPEFREAIEKYNATHRVQIPPDVRVHPGTGKGRWVRMYIDGEDLAALDDAQVKRLANHEFYHILNPSKKEKEAIAVLNDDLIDIRAVLFEVENRRLTQKAEEERRVKEALLTNSKAMAEAIGKNIGPDVVIIVSSTDEQAEFWQKRLTGGDDIHGSGQVIKTDAVVLSVPESNWKGGAGNGLGTLNGFVQAARQASRRGLIDVPEDAPVPQLINALMAYIKGKSSFLFHTAGKGTRTAPLPGAEVNSKPNIKLPKMVDVRGELKPVTILESVLMETSIYAPSRQNRLSVFWGDQVIVNEENIDYGGKHHVEIFGQLVPLDKDIEAYGVLVPGEEGDCKQREKLSLEEVRKILPKGSDEVYKSIGSFSVSLPFFAALIGMEEHIDLLGKQAGSLNTDPDWWQPLTSTRDEYIGMIGKKGVGAKEAADTWDKMNSFWTDFAQSVEYWESKIQRRIGFNDVGQHSFWWDYGQNKFYLRNMQILTEDSMEGEAARNFFGIEEGKWVDDKSDVGAAEVENSVVQNSKIKKGKLKNCVVIDSDLEEVYAENAIIIGSTIIKLKADGALCYNVVDHNVSLREGQVLANIFHPELGRFTMRTHISRDGQADWKGEVHVYDNPYTYSKVNELMAGIKMEAVEKVKQGESAKLRAEDPLTGAELAQQLSDTRGIGIEEAREIVAYRMLTFGDVEFFYDGNYIDIFGIDAADARSELENLASAEKEGTALAGIEKAEAEVKGETHMTYKKIPAISRKESMGKAKHLKFGTSGLRDLVTNMTDMECYINTRGFIKFLKERGEIDDANNIIAVSGDRRSSTPRIMAAVIKAIEDEGCVADYVGLTPTPTVAYYAMQKGMPSVMVTGSHIPEDRNGIKFTKKAGEVLKPDETDILKNVARARTEETAIDWKEALFGEDGMFKEEHHLTEATDEAEELYVKRYLDVFPADALKGKKIVFYQHSAVGRDIIQRVLMGLGATVIVVGRSEAFVPVDTEKVPESTRALFREWTAEYKPDFIMFTDGDSDRPGLVDETGEFLPGDKLGALVSMYLKPQAVGLPVSANDAVVDVLKAQGIEVAETRIGSPYVIAAMNDALAKDPGAKVASWESNGGYLLGSDWTINGKTLKALPTRDALFPLLIASIFATQEGKTASQLIADKLPPRYVVADAVNNKMEGTEAYTPEMGSEIKRTFKPTDETVISAEFRPAEANKPETVYIHFIDGKGASITGAMAEELQKIKSELAKYFIPEEGIGEIRSINFRDGIKMGFASGDGIHIRPSGNEPILRFYVQSPSQERARELVAKRLGFIQPLVAAMTEAETPGTEAVRVGSALGKAITALDQKLKAGEPIHFVPSFRTGKDGYTWGQPVRDNFILELMGAKTADERIALAEQYGIPAEEVIGERWITAGQVDTGQGVLPSEVLALWPAQVPGSNITAKALTSGRPLSLQYHRFPEMIVPLEDGYAYLGLNRDVTPEKFIDNLKKGDVSMFNRVELKKGQPIIVPPYMIHAYGIVRVYEVKAVTADQDKAGTISFYDRLRLNADQQHIVAETVAFTPPAEIADKLVVQGLARPGKDVLTLPADTVQAIADELEREGSLNKADLSVAMYTPVTVIEKPGVKYEKMGEAPGFVNGRYTIDEAGSITVAPAIQGKQHSLFVTEGVVRILNKDGEQIDVLTQGEERMLPVNVGKYSLMAVQGPAVVYTQYVPERPTEARVTTVQMERGEQTIKDLPESVPAYVTTGVVTPGETMVDIVEVNTAVSVDKLPIHDGRDFVIDVISGEIELRVKGEKVADYGPEDALMVSEDQIIDTKGRIFPRLDIKDYELVKKGDKPATVEVRYEKTEAESIVYSVYEKVRRHIEKVKAEQIDLILPSEMFVPGGKSTVGSAEWEEEQLRRYVSDKIRISTYNAKMGLAEAAKKTLNKGAVGILVATESSIKDADRDDKELTGFLQGKKGTLRTLAIPDLDALEDKGWFFNREVEGTALLLASVTPEQIKVEGEDNAADDLQRLMAQLIGKPIPRQYLYYMLSYDEIGDAMNKLPAELQSDPFGWLRFLVQNLLLKMPIRAFNATEQLHQRRKIMWSV